LKRGQVIHSDAMIGTIRHACLFPESFFRCVTPRHRDAAGRSRDQSFTSKATLRLDWLATSQRERDQRRARHFRRYVVEKCVAGFANKTVPRGGD